MTNTPDPIAHAARLLREAAQELKQAHTIGGSAEWDGTEPEVQAVYDEHMAAAAAIEEWERAVGAGGVEPLRKPAAQPSRECLQQSAEPASVDAMARILFAAWSKAEPGHGVTQHPTSYWSTFADMARAALQAAPPAPKGVAVPDEHEAFEAWAPSCFPGVKLEREGDGYRFALAKEWWAAWQARAALAAAPAQEHATQLAGHGQAYSIDADPEGIRARVAEAITGALASGGKKSDRPADEHWLRPFWMHAYFAAIQFNALRDSAEAMLGAPVQAQEDARVQWWLATIDMHGNPTLTDGAHSDRAGADKAAYLIDALGVGQGKKYAVARVELSAPKPNADGVNYEAVAQCNHAARAAQGSK